MRLFFKILSRRTAASKLHRGLLITTVFLGCSILTTSGCSSKPIHHNAEYSGDEARIIYTVTATSSNEVRASDLAMEKAVAKCKPQKQEVLLIEHLSKYQGMTNGEKKLIGLANRELDVSSSSVSPFDYRAILKFRCVEKQK